MALDKYLDAIFPVNFLKRLLLVLILKEAFCRCCDLYNLLFKIRKKSVSVFRIIIPRHLCRGVYSFRLSVRPFVCSFVRLPVRSFVRSYFRPVRGIT